MSLPQSIGVFNGYAIFSIDGRFYKTPISNAVTSRDAALALIASGTAIPQAEAYDAQFPWLYEQFAWVTEPGNGAPSGVNVVTENGDEIWA